MNTQMETLSQTLGQLYRSYGYEAYTMSKFEEYALYLRNKDFLISDRVLTFTDTDGKLMALKPDVTLSIIKNTRQAAGVQKLYYRETVYRPGNSGFREIMQVGLECMGSVDDYCILEVLVLAVKSLRAIGKNYVLDISHMGLLSMLLDRYDLQDSLRQQITDAIGDKNAHTVKKLCQDAGIPEEALCALTKLGGRAEQVLPALDAIFGDAPALAQLKRLVAALNTAGCGNCVNIDFSVVNDMRYYNGIVFRGFVEGVPDGVLSGGQYDAMMTKMGRSDKAIGFAVYPELLDRLAQEKAADAAEAVLFYGADCDLGALCLGVQSLMEKGVTVKVLPEGAPAQNFQKCYRMVGNEVKEYA